MNKRTTESTENFLTAVYRLTRISSYASTKDIAAALHVTMPTVSEKIGKLTQEKYLHHIWRKGVSLTHTGNLTALKILRKHRIIETFLLEILKFPIEDLHEEACHLEHASSNYLIDSMDAILGNPEKDPHGHPIPDKEGNISDTNFLSLADTIPMTELVISQVNDENRDKLHYLKENGIVPGVIVKVLEIAPFNEPMHLEIDKKTIFISREMARKIYIETSNFKKTE